MPCFMRVQAFRHAENTSLITFRRSEAATKKGGCSSQFGNWTSEPDTASLDCKQCIGCKMDYSLEWAVRCMCEARFFEKCSFLTLTYDEQSLPENGNLVYAHVQDFMKRLRYHLKEIFGLDVRIRYFGCSEYGEQFLRPHFHIALYGEDFCFDRQFAKRTRAGHSLYVSQFLQMCWKHGFVWIGDLTFDSASYISQYVVKKVFGDEKRKAAHYGDKTPERVFMSLKPGLGYDYYKKYKDTLYPNDFIVLPKGDRYCRFRLPKYFDELLKEDDPALYQQVKDKRFVYFQEQLKAHPEEFTHKRIREKYEYYMEMLKRKKREYEEFV